MNKSLHFSSANQAWSTPKDLYLQLNDEFNFELDPACHSSNQICPSGYAWDKGYDGLKEYWACYRNIFLNPPYGRELKNWIKKASDESKLGCTVVCLIPYRPDTKYWFDYIWEEKPVKDRIKEEIFLKVKEKLKIRKEYIFGIKTRKNVEIRAIKGRLKFGDSKNAAPFPSAIVIFKGKRKMR